MRARCSQTSCQFAACLARTSVPSEETRLERRLQNELGASWRCKGSGGGPCPPCPVTCRRLCAACFPSRRPRLCGDVLICVPLPQFRAKFHAEFLGQCPRVCQCGRLSERGSPLTSPTLAAPSAGVSSVMAAGCGDAVNGTGESKDEGVSTHITDARSRKASDHRCLSHIADACGRKALDYWQFTAASCRSPPDQLAS